MAVNEERYREAEEHLWKSLGGEPIDHWLVLEHTGVKVRVQELGEGAPILFVHGANTSGTSWASLVSRLRGVRSFLLDRPGTGLSEPLARPLDAATLPAHGDTLLADVLDALGLSSAHLVATSFGGYIALRTAAAHTHRVKRMIQFSWPVGAPTAHVPMLLRIAGLPGVARLMAAVPASEQSVRMMFRQIGHGRSLNTGRITPELVAWYLSLLRHTDTMLNELTPSRAFISPLSGLNRVLLPDDVLARVAAPTHFLWGEQDPFATPDTARMLVERLPNATMEILPGAGHAPWLDDVRYCAAIVDRHLRER